MATLTGARAGHTNGWHRIQAQAGLAGPSRLQVQDKLGIWGGCGCKLLGWEVVLFKPKRCVFLCFFLCLVVLFVVLIFVIKLSGKLRTFCVFFVDEVVVGATYKIN